MGIRQALAGRGCGLPILAGRDLTSWWSTKLCVLSVSDEVCETTRRTTPRRGGWESNAIHATLVPTSFTEGINGLGLIRSRTQVMFDSLCNHISSLILRATYWHPFKPSSFRLGHHHHHLTQLHASSSLAHPTPMRSAGVLPERC